MPAFHWRHHAHRASHRHTNPRTEQNTQGAQVEGGALDPAAKARVRTEGAAGGLEGGMKADSQKDGRASVGQGSPNRRDQRPKQAGEGRVHDETSSDREAGRGARGSIR